jgi:hypothetical protein
LNGLRVRLSPLLVLFGFDEAVTERAGWREPARNPVSEAP